MGQPLPHRFGDYVLVKRLGSGAMGDVFLARPDPDVGVPSPCVIKRLHPALMDHDGFLDRFRHEAEIASMVDSPFVSRCFDAGNVEDVAYIAIEYIAGWSLGQALKDRMPRHDLMSIADVARIVDDTARGLRALHEAVDPKTGAPLAIIHRDVSPKNLMLGRDGRTRVIDLGIGKSALQGWRTRTGDLLGAPGYMAPEQVAGESIDQRADVYALGIIMFELLTLEFYVPRGGIAVMLHAALAPNRRPPSSLRPGVPPELDDVVMRALEVDRQDRFQSVGDLHRALRTATEEQTEDDERTIFDIGDALLADLSKRQTELGQLLDRVDSTFIAPTSVRTNIYARRGSTQRPAEVQVFDVEPRQDPGPVRTRIVRDITRPQSGPPQAELPSIPSTVQPTLTPRSGLTPAVAVAIAVVALVLGIMLERMVLTDKAPAIQVIAVEPTPDKPTLTVTPRPSGLRAVPAKAEPEPTAPPNPHIITLQPEPRPNPARRPRRASAAASDAVPSIASDRLSVSALADRIKRLSKTLPADSPHKSEVVKLRLRLLQESRAADTPALQSRLQRLEAEIRRIEDDLP